MEAGVADVDMADPILGSSLLLWAAAGGTLKVGGLSSLSILIIQENHTNISLACVLFIGLGFPYGPKKTEIHVKLSRNVDILPVFFRPFRSL